MRDKTGCPANPCYGDVEPGSKHCSWDLCPLDALEGIKRRHTLPYTIAMNSPPVQERATLSAWYIARAIAATWLRTLADWIAP